MVKCTAFKQYNQRHTHESTKREENNFELQHKNMCNIWHSLKGVTAQNKKCDYSGQLAHALKRVQRMGSAV